MTGILSREQRCCLSLQLGRKVGRERERDERMELNGQENIGEGKEQQKRG